MKRTTTLFTLLVIAGLMHAQITVTNSTFPVAGDTLRTAIDRTDIPAQPLFTPPGGNQTWDLSFLGADERQSTIYRPASAGGVSGSFPEAELVTIGANGAETYFDVNSTSFNIAGLFGNDPLGGLLPIDMIMPVRPPLPERNAPLNFFDIRQSSSSIFVGFSAADIPSELLGQLPIMPDSIRIRAAISQVSAVDAWGTMMIPGGTYEVLRDKRTTYTDVRIDAKVPPLGWLDITDVAIQLLGLQGLGVDTTVTFHFFNNIEKEQIAIVQFNTAVNTVVQVQYKDNAPPSAVGDVSGEQGHVAISPNPASDEAIFELRNFTPGVYSLRLFDTRGTLVMITVLVNTSETIPLDPLQSGTYFYQVLNERQQVMARGKLMKVD